MEHNRFTLILIGIIFISGVFNLIQFIAKGQKEYE
jgi:hypothetical protein